MQVPSKAELKQFFDEEQAPAVHFVETVASWPSLRILDYLYSDGPVSTGEVARALNMDMRDVKDGLDALAEKGIVNEGENGWTASTDEVTITLTRDEGIHIAYATADRDRPVTAVSESDKTDSDPEGVLARIHRFFRSLF